MERIALIGFGEAGKSFALAAGWGGDARAFDIAGKAEDCAEAKVTACVSSGAAIHDSRVVLSLVTADQAIAAATDAAGSLQEDAFYFDMNSVAPDTKRTAALAIEAAGGHYIDVAIIAPVNPARLAEPLLLSGPHAQGAALALRGIGFTSVRVVGDDIGQASTIKMIRSIMIKGVEALTAEMMMAADAAGVADEVLFSLGSDWLAKADYNLKRMRTHGSRRAAEMEEAAKTLEALGVEPLMTRGTIALQRKMAG